MPARLVGVALFAVVALGALGGCHDPVPAPGDTDRVDSDVVDPDDSDDSDDSDRAPDSATPTDSDSDSAPLDADRDGVPADLDCDDDDAAVHPGAVETCNDLDDDCSGRIDDLVEPPVWWLDRDGDGFGDPTAAFASCSRPPAFVAAGLVADCKDDDPRAWPGADEVAGDGVDEDCDGVDDCFTDDDGDHYGTGTPHPGTSLRCDGFLEATSPGDCDDDAFDVWPRAPERCGLVDHDCDGIAGDDDRDAADPSTWFGDDDGDGFGNPLDPVAACVAPPGTVVDATDCNDDVAATRPGGQEVCNLADDDCDGLTDDADPTVQGGTAWHRDRDRDRFGDPALVRVACAPSGDYDVVDDRDCDDTLAVRNPLATEVAGNTLDENCDGALLCFVDADRDGLAGSLTGPVVAASCHVPGYAATIADCDDTDAAVTRLVFYADLDHDGYGDVDQGIGACVPPLNYVLGPGDCDDGNRDVHPLAVETPGDLVDADCDGLELCFEDGDVDAHGGPGTVVSPDLRCDAPGEAVRHDDCDDDDSDVHPGAVERIGDGLDADCDGSELCFRDADSDGHGVAVLVLDPDLACAADGVAPTPDDCDDDDAAIHPDAGERCRVGDDDCDGLVDDADPDLVGAPTWFADQDHDGLGAGAPIAACVVPFGAVAQQGDCDDALPGWSVTCPWAIVAAGDAVTCAARTDHDVACVGWDVAAPAPLVALDVAGRLACGLDEDGAARCWGDAPADDPRRDVPVGSFTAIDVGEAGACVLDGDGAIACWGDVTPAPDGPFVAIAVGEGTACAADAAGDVVCWGDAVCAVSLGAAETLAADGGVACRLDVDGRLACDGCADDRADAAPTEPLLRFADVALGPAGTCATTVSGDLTCWGALPDVASPPSTNAIAVTVGARHACALASDRTVACWGEDAGALQPPGP